MKIGIIGLPQVGKKTFFEVVTDKKLSEGERASHKPIKGTLEIRDKRFDRLAEIYKPKKTLRARIEIDILPKLEREAIQKGEIFSEINEMDALCHVVRAFQDDTVYHVSGSVDPKRDIDTVNAELLLHDLILIEKRLERLDKEITKSKTESDLSERQLLLKLKAHLEKEAPLRLLDLTNDEKKIISSYPFTTRKAMLIVLNVSEDDLKDNTLVEKFKKDYEKLILEFMQVSAKVESEIEEFESEEERSQFLKSLGVDDFGINVFTSLCLKALDLVSFFTVKSDELRQWTIKKGSTALDAAGTIHSDIRRGFIRAEVVKYSDLASLGTEEKVKELGRFYLKGKDYTVEDGDIITVRFNV